MQKGWPSTQKEEARREADERKKREREIVEATKEERKRDISEMEVRILEKVKPKEGDGRAQTVEEERHCYLILTDSNGRDVTADSVRNHMPKTERQKYDINVEVAYRLEDALYRVESGQLDVAGRYVVVDNLTNNVRGGRRSAPDSPEQLVRRVHELRQKLLSASAKAVIISEVKPMREINVRPYNELLHRYLLTCGKTGFGSKTQIRMNHLNFDGYHVSPMFDSIIDRTYAYALLGIDVPDPTPMDEFTPAHLRRRWEQEWPTLEGQRRAYRTWS